MSKRVARTAQFNIRLTPEERAQLDELAQAKGLTGSAYLRMKIREKYQQEKGNRHGKV